MDFVWKNCEDRFDAIVEQTSQVFSTVLSIYDLVHGPSQSNEKDNSFVEELLLKLMETDWHKKVLFNYVTN